MSATPENMLNAIHDTVEPALETAQDTIGTALETAKNRVEGMISAMSDTTKDDEMQSAVTQHRNEPIEAMNNAAETA